MIASDKEPWRAQANCLNMDTELFFPTREGRGAGGAAKAVCAECCVVEPCLQDALDAKVPGIQGGTSERERRFIRRGGFTALQYLKGVEDGSIKRPLRGRPPKSV